MHAGLFDVFHDAADQDALAVADAVDIDFGRKIQKTIQQYRAVVGYLNRRIHVSGQVLLAVHHLHRSTAEDVGRSYHQRKTDVGCHLQRLFLTARGAVRRLLELQRFDEILEALAIFGKIDGVRRSADDGRTGRCQCLGEL